MAGSGTGQPVRFSCSVCRRVEWRRNKLTGGIDDVDFTGRVDKVPPGLGGRRVSAYRFEYRCKVCGHVGQSRHVHCERAFVARGGILPGPAKYE